MMTWMLSPPWEASCHRLFMPPFLLTSTLLSIRCFDTPSGVARDPSAIGLAGLPLRKSYLSRTPIAWAALVTFVDGLVPLLLLFIHCVAGFERSPALLIVTTA